MKMRCVVACTNSQGESDFFPCVVECTQDQYNNGDHYDAAREAAKDESYEGPDMVVFDDNDGHKFLFIELFNKKNIVNVKCE